MASTLLAEMIPVAITKTSLGKWPGQVRARVSWHHEVNTILFCIIFAPLGMLMGTTLSLYSTMTVNGVKFSHHVTMWNSSFRWVQRPFRAAPHQHSLSLYLIPWHVTRFCSHLNAKLKSGQKCFLLHLFNTSFTNHCIIHYIIQVTGSALKQIKNTLIKIT